MDIFNWIYSGKVVQTPLKCWKQVTLNYDIDKKDVHICHSADHVEKESKKVTISLKRLKKSALVLFRGIWCYDFIVSWYRNGIASKKFRRTGCQARQGLIQSFCIEYLGQDRGGFIWYDIERVLKRCPELVLIRRTPCQPDRKQLPRRENSRIIRIAS